MQLTNRTVFIAGGTSGIGRGLAERLAAAGNVVVVGGRRLVDGAEYVPLDVTDAGSVQRARDAVLAAHPELDVVITMAGVMLTEDLRDPAHVEAAEATIATNLLGTIRVVDAFTPHLIERGGGAIMTVSSGIAFLPFPLMPTYAATKAGVHAYTEALRAQLAGTGVEVTELVPPAVATAGQEKVNPATLPLEAYLDEVLALLATDPTPPEILVRAVHQHRWAERDGTYAELVARRSEAMRTLPGR